MENSNSATGILIVLLLVFICVNLFILDLKVFSPQENIRLSDVTTSASPLPTRFSSPVLSENLTAACPQTCLTTIREATKSSPAIGRPEPAPSASLNQTFSSPAREFYIPLGSGTTQKNIWDDLTGTETVIDPANYGNIREAYFIASLKNPTQNGQTEVQLYNVTDKHPVWGSHLIMNGPLEQTLASGKIVLDTGNKLYRVQLKSSLQYPVNLEYAKIRIIAD